MVWFIYGNLSAQNALSIVSRTSLTLKLKPLPLENIPQDRQISLPSGKTCKLEFVNKNEKNENSVLVSYFEGNLNNEDLSEGLMNQMCR